MVSGLNDYRKPLVNHVHTYLCQSLPHALWFTVHQKYQFSVQSSQFQLQLWPTSSTQHTCQTHVYFQGMCAHLCSLCELYMPCPHMVIHTYVYNYKMAAYADRQACTQLTIQTQKIAEFFIFAPS